MEEQPAEGDDVVMQTASTSMPRVSVYRVLLGGKDAHGFSRFDQAADVSDSLPAQVLL